MSNLNELNKHLFAELDRLSEDCKTPEQIEAECQRAAAIVKIAEQIVDAADLQLKAVTVLANHGDRFKPMLPMIEANAR
jgi:hypothetical protein